MSAQPKGPWKGHRWHKSTLRQRFEEKFRVTPSCWIWVAGFTQSGYGAIKADGVQTRAHRLSYELYIGPIPHGLIVMHRCDNPACVNPDHLQVGTGSDNVLDMVKKGRIRTIRGEEQWASRLTESQIVAIRKDTRKVSDIAHEYGMTGGNIRKIKARLSWAHVK